MKMEKLNKKLLFAPWAASNRQFSIYQGFYIPFKKIFKEVVMFDPQANIYLYGQDEMNKRLLSVVEKEKPDYIFFLISYDELYIETLLKIKEISPESIMINYFGDDDTQFENFSLYYCHLFDYCLTFPQLSSAVYKREGIDNIFFSSGRNLDQFKPLNLDKKYDVTFIGTPKMDRHYLLKYLYDNGINLKVFGAGWYKYSDLSKIYGGPLDDKQITKIINQTKINLCFSKNGYGEPHLKGIVFEIGACGSFVLAEYSHKLLDFFEEDREIIMFKNKEELLGKIRYYLKHENEREKIEKKMYTKVVKKQIGRAHV